MAKQHKKDGKKVFLNKAPNGEFRRSFFGNFIISVLVIFFVISIYSLFSGGSKNEEVGISELARSVKVGEVKEISVKNGVIEAVFKDDTVKTSKKEETSNIAETLAAYGVTEEELGAVKVSVNQDGGFFYWLLNLSPILFPILFIAVFIAAPISAGERATTTPAFSSARILSSARPLPPLIIAPACSMRLPLGAVWPAM